MSDGDVSPEAELIRFELGESPLAAAHPPVPTSELMGAAQKFMARYDASHDIRYLNAVLKMVDREQLRQQHPAAHGLLCDWSSAALQRFRASRGLS